MIGLDEFPEPRLPVSNSHHNSTHMNTTSSQQNNSSIPIEKPSTFHITPDEIGEISDSSSSSSDGDSDSEDEANSTVLERNLTSNDRNNGHCNGIQNSTAPKFNSVPTSRLLKEDLCLSESGSDSD